MDVKIVNDYSDYFKVAREPLFLNPDGVRNRFPIGWEGKGRYKPGTLRLYNVKDNILIDPATYSEEENGIFFSFTAPPPTGDYKDISVLYVINPDDYAFSMGTKESDYPGEEYFLFPNWNSAKGCGDAFWVGKYAASNESNVPVSKKNRGSWVNTRWDSQVNSCLTKGTGFHCIRNREWVSIALWTEKLGITVYGNFNGYNNTSDIDMRGIGTSITSDMNDPTDNYHKILTGSGTESFRKKGRMDGISDLAGNVWEAVDGLQLRNGTVYVLNSDNTEYVSLGSGVITPNAYTSSSGSINYINNSTNDLLNEGLPVDSAGMAVPGTDILWKSNSGTRICYRGALCSHGAGAGIWALLLLTDVSNSYWTAGFRLARSL